MSKSYVFDGTEVVKTGRIATKTVTVAGTTKKEMTYTLVEIKPADSMGPSWKKWVKESDLYEIQ